MAEESSAERESEIKKYRLRGKRYSYSFLGDDDSAEESARAKVAKLTEHEKLLKKHEEKGSLETFREREKNRVKEYRKSLTPEQKEKKNALQKAAQARYRARQKEKREKECATRSSAEKRTKIDKAEKEKHRLYMQKWREHLPPEKTTAINQKRMERYYSQKTRAISSPSKPSSSNTDQCKEPQCITPPDQSVTMGSPFKSANAKRKAASRASRFDPKDPAKFASVKAYQLKCAMKSPRKRAALAQYGIGQSQNPVGVKFQENMNSYLKTLQMEKNMSATKRRKKLVSILIKDSSHTVQELSKQLEQRWHFVAAASTLKEEQEELTTTRRNSRLAAEGVFEAVEEFYNRPETAVIVPDRKMVKKDLIPKAVLSKSLSSLHKEFVKETGKVISLSTFKRQRPQHILTMKNLKRTSCLCKVCTNVVQKVDALKPFTKATSIFPVSQDLWEIVTLTLCPKGDQSHHSWDCINRKCKNCGVQVLQDSLAKLPDETVNWYRWQQYDGQQRLGNVLKKGSVAELISELTTELNTLASHLATARWQYRQFRQLRQNLPSNQVLTLMDFAENYRCEYQNEIQAAHWSYNQVTVFPTVNYYKCQCDQLVTESVIFITDDLQHDASAVNAFNSMVLKHLRDKRGLKLEQQFQFTDGAAGQFKSREPFVDLSCSVHDHGIPVERSFFGSSHGKGPCDGMGGLVKSVARRAVLSGKEVIQNAKQMYEYLQANHTVDASDFGCCHSKRIFFHAEQINRKNRSDRRPNNPVPGTRKIHCVRTDGEKNKIAFRYLSCYCDPCRTKIGSCEEKEMMLDWKTHQFRTPHSPAPTSEPVQPSSLGPASSQSAPQHPAPSQSAPQHPATPEPIPPPATPEPIPPPATPEPIPPPATPEPTDFSLIQRQLDRAKSFEDVKALAVETASSFGNIRVRNSLQAEKFLRDQLSAELYPSDGPALLPVRIYGDGNCLPRCGSVLSFGSEEYHKEIRARIVLEMAGNEDYYLNPDLSPILSNLPKMFAQYSDFYATEVLNTAAVKEIFHKEVMEAKKPSTYMGMWQVYALASVLQSPIHSIYPQHGGFTVRGHLHHLVKPRCLQPHGSPEVGIMWTHTLGKHLPAKTWRPNHFVVCLPETPDLQQLHISQGDFILVAVPNEKGQVTTYVAQVTRISEEGPWGSYLTEAENGLWKWPETEPHEFFIPRQDILRVLRDYAIKQDRRRSIAFSFT